MKLKDCNSGARGLERTLGRSVPRQTGLLRGPLAALGPDEAWREEKARRRRRRGRRGRKQDKMKAR